MYILMPLFHLKYGYLITPQHHQQRVEGKSLVRRRFSREKMEKFFFFLLFHLLFSHKAHISKSYDYVQQRQLHCVWAMRWGEEKLACAHETKISTSLLIKDVLCSADIELIWRKRKKKNPPIKCCTIFRLLWVVWEILLEYNFPKKKHIGIVLYMS